MVKHSQSNIQDISKNTKHTGQVVWKKTVSFDFFTNFKTVKYDFFTNFKTVKFGTLKIVSVNISSNELEVK